MKQFLAVSGLVALLFADTAAALAADAEIDRAAGNVSAAFQAAYAAAEAAAIAGPGQLSAMKQMQPALQAWSQVANARVDALNAEMKTTKSKVSSLTAEVSAATGRENVANAKASAAQAKAATLWEMLEKKDGEVRRLQNQLAAEQNATKLKPNPVLKAHPNMMLNDKGEPLMIGPGVSPAKR